MLTTLIAWVYISFICWSWGTLFTGILKKKPLSGMSYCFSITCLTGLAIIGIIAQIISLFTGLGHAAVQLAFLIPAILIFVFYGRRKMTIKAIRAALLNITVPSFFLLITLLLLILIMSVYDIRHPDTLAYHEKIIAWTEQYKAIPGLVHIEYHLGYQSVWFVLCALFSFSFTGTPALTFMNTTILVWLFLFIVQKISSIEKQKGTHHSYFSFLWICMLGVVIWGYTQVRLTATSVSPDFIAAIYILLIGYLFVQRATNVDSLLICFFCFFAITIKLSALPVILFVCYLVYPFEKKKIGLIFCLAFLAVVPFATRNMIISGYPFFPVGFPDIVNADWKYEKSGLPYVRDYIVALARTQDMHTNIYIILNKPFTTWIRQWWLHISMADKFMMAGLIISILFFTLNLKRSFFRNKGITTAQVIAFIGVLFWFFNAPDPRFGLGFILLFPALVFWDNTLLREKTGRLFKPAGFISFLCILMGCAVISYNVYRCIRYFRSAEIISPTGIPPSPHKSFYYNGVKMNVPRIEGGYGNIFLPDTTDHIHTFRMRGATIEEGFKKEKPR